MLQHEHSGSCGASSLALGFTAPGNFHHILPCALCQLRASVKGQDTKCKQLEHGDLRATCRVSHCLRSLTCGGSVRKGRRYSTICCLPTGFFGSRALRSANIGEQWAEHTSPFPTVAQWASVSWPLGTKWRSFSWWPATPCKAPGYSESGHSPNTEEECPPQSAGPMEAWWGVLDLEKQHPQVEP